MRTHKQQIFGLFSCILFLAFLFFGCADSNTAGDSISAQTDTEESLANESTSPDVATDSAYPAIPSVPGAIWFTEDNTSEGAYHSSLLFFSDDSSFQQYNYQSSPETSGVQSGEWSVDESGAIILNIPDQETVTVTIVADIGFGFFFYREVLIDGESEPPYNAVWWSCDPELFPFDDSLIRGTYTIQYGDKWVFDSNGTGSAPGGEGAFMWEVVDGLLVVSFHDGREYWMYKIQGRVPVVWPGEQFYREISWAYVEYDENGEFDSYHGAMKLIHQE